MNDLLTEEQKQLHQLLGFCQMFVFELRHYPHAQRKLEERLKQTRKALEFDRQRRLGMVEHG